MTDSSVVDYDLEAECVDIYGESVNIEPILSYYTSC
jgi:hypothetical protein